MNKTICFFLTIGLLLSIVSQPIIACSDFLLNNSGNSVVSARTMDFGIPLQAEVVVMPRGQKYMQWTSKYGFVGTNAANLPAFTDGLNEKGLSVGTLWLTATKYQDVSKLPQEKVIQVRDVANWILGSFATVDEVKKGLKKVVVTGSPFKEMNNMVLPLHLAIHDRNKKSIVVEFVGGKMQIYDNPHNVMTNDPQFPDQIKNLDQYKNLTNTREGMLGLPGDSMPESRFVRIYTLNKFVQKSKNTREAVNNAKHIMDRITMVNGERTGYITEYGLIRDHKNLVYYVVDDENMNLRALDMKKLDFSPGAKRLAMSISADNWFVPANGELKPF
ncbi:linear amide C-N hydrolase [bacterium]|nr:linear amide C-N hydrolase [bacterium]MBT4551483.1 linear amide C-N hydrolase [bacterium]MBT7088821.1 linear amide C-N hydrolase [bacterium]